ncbi:unnamed protein product [Pseudo-nitzschia multistriata]|uniref:Uncharacterized protein n=1 Tax=Pseudo-nitzschia multistriata TaxID=183589 RepID=A0A448Z8P1_9STRA|nr:unnamed protein product [Pseudo-nitzschia multistriata]
MKLLSNLLILSAIAGASEGFSVVPAGTKATASSTELRAETGRREMVAATLAAGAAVLPFGQAAVAAYVPQVNDMKQIYFLGESLDKLIAKLEDPSQMEAALTGVKQFNKDPDFYSTYTRNFILKSIKKGADSDPRVGYIKQASALISSLEGVLTGGDALMNEKSTSAEAVARVKKAQALIAKFIDECGVEDPKLAAFVSSHK